MIRKFIVGIDLGGTNLKVALLDCKYRILHKEVLSTKDFSKKDQLISAIIQAVRSILRNGGISDKQLVGLGIGLPGPIDTVAGLVHFFPNIPGWKDVNLRNTLEKKLKIPVSIDNDANLMCLAEFKKGAARGAQNAVCLTLGTGVGAGLIIERKLFRGSSFAAGELGHVPLNEAGPRCNCGGTACLEAYIGNKRVMKKARQVFGRNIPLDELSAMAKKGDKRALGIWNEFSAHLGRALVVVVNLLNPDKIVIGGGVAAAGRVIFDRVRKVVATDAMSVQAKRVSILKARLGSDAGMIGAAILVNEGNKV